MTESQVHVAGEIAALLVVAPFMGYLVATSPRPIVRQLAGGILVATVVIDGGLLLNRFLGTR